MVGWLWERFKGGGPLLTVMLFTLLLGVFLGLAAPKAVDADTLAATRLLVGNYIQALPEASIDPWRESLQTLLMNGAVLVIMALCGLHLLGLPLAVALLFVKGASLGYAMGFLLDYQGLSGFAVIFLSMLPQNLLLLPAFTLAAYLAACFSLTMLRCGRPSPGRLGMYGLRFAVLLALIALAALVHGYFCPLLLKMFFLII